MIFTEDLHDWIPSLIDTMDECPFCGGKKFAFSHRRLRYHRPAQYKVRFRCVSCNFGTRWTSRDPEKVIHIWNSAERRK